MDALTLVAYTYELGSSLVERCELVKQCHSESSRIAVRTVRVLGQLEGASKEFSGSVEFDASLVELKQALEQARDLVARCQKARGVSAKIGALMRASTLKQELLSVDSDLDRIASDLQLPMLTDIRRALERINEKERQSEAAAAGEPGVGAEALEQAIRDAIRKELHSSSGGGGQQAVDDVIKRNLAQLYEEAGAIAADRVDPSAAEAEGSGTRKLLCPGHNEECVLRTTQKAVRSLHANIARRGGTFEAEMFAIRLSAVHFFFGTKSSCGVLEKQVQRRLCAANEAVWTHPLT